MLKYRLVYFYAVLCVVIVVIAIFFLDKLDKTIKVYEEEEKLSEKLEEIKTYESSLPVKNIKVKITSTGEIKTMTMNEYLIGVVPSEMPPSHELEALKAQAIIARTYAYEKMSHKGHSDCDVCDNYSHCQAYYNIEQIQAAWKRKGYDEELRKEYLEKVKEAVYSTENIVAIYKGELIKAYFHANSGGKTEDVSAIWGKQNIPYLVSVESLGEEQHQYYKTTVELSIASLEEKLTKNTTKPCSLNNITKELIKIESYTNSGRVDKVNIGGNIYTANELRGALGLKSTNFTVKYSDGKVIFNVTGYGHGIGMSQTGANYYAIQGYDAEKIVKHYYTGVDIAYLKTKE